MIVGMVKTTMLRFPKRPFPEENHAPQALILDRPDEHVKSRNSIVEFLTRSRVTLGRSSKRTLRVRYAGHPEKRNRERS